MNIYESAEDYLESILIITERKGNCRSIDISTELGFSKPSVSIAMKKLKENGHIEILDHGSIILTESGKNIAAKVYERHLILTKALISIGVSEKQAKIDACKVEHDISDETFNMIKKNVIKEQI